MKKHDHITIGSKPHDVLRISEMKPSARRASSAFMVVSDLELACVFVPVALAPGVAAALWPDAVAALRAVARIAYQLPNTLADVAPLVHGALAQLEER